MPLDNSVSLPSGVSAVFGVSGKTKFTGNQGDYLNLGHSAAFETQNGTISLGFKAHEVDGRQAIFSKDGSGYDDGGHLTVWIENGVLKVRMQSDSESVYVTLSDIPIEEGALHALAVSFGKDGLKVYLDGELVAAEPSFTRGIKMNDRDLLVGAHGMWRTSDEQSPADFFDGAIMDFMVFDSALDPEDIAVLSGGIDPEFGDNAEQAAMVADLMPVFEQVHHGSDTFKALAMEYGFNHDGSLKADRSVTEGTSSKDTMVGGKEADLLNGKNGHDTLEGKGGRDILQGGHGNDLLKGGKGRDVLDGGHGEDILRGGGGNDLLISTSDGREGGVAYDPDRDEGIDKHSADKETGKVYLDQPVHADDIMTGGSGADIFYFQTQINAKQKFIEKHTNNDGTIRWHGVAGENDNIHDHWVDTIGNDVITDFSRSEGDQIVIEGHTTEILSIEHLDGDGDGVVDHSVITLYSDQGGGGGAHNDDILGTITVFGDLVTENDIEHTSKPAYGIVYNIDDLPDALKPEVKAKDRGEFNTPDDLPTFEAGDLPNGIKVVAGVAGKTKFSGNHGDYLDLGHSEELELKNGTISLGFKAHEVDGRQSLFSKDGSGYDDGGHLTAWIENGVLKIRMQSESESVYVSLYDYPIEEGALHSLAVSFGKDGLKVYLDGELVAAEPTFTRGIKVNDRDLLVGAHGMWRTDDDEQSPADFFDGSIMDFMVIDGAVDPEDIIELSGMIDPDIATKAGKQASVADLMPVFQQAHHGSETFKQLAMDYGFKHDGSLMSGRKITDGGKGDDTMVGNENANLLNGGLGDDTIDGDSGNDILQGDHGNDELRGGSGNDVLDGGHGEDILKGGAGDDLLISTSDGREGAVAYDPNRDEGIDKHSADKVTGKVYLDQPVHADDILTGGKGADIFYFQTQINAKQKFIEKHTNNDGTIRWHGVAGENDNIHDHWVDTIGNDVITDFSRSEGDRIVIEGHTTEILSIIHVDGDGDGIVDHSVITLYSDQGGGGGAHNDDILGTITVFGDLVTESDIEHTAKPAYGIVTDIDDLKDALKPEVKAVDRGTGDTAGDHQGAAPTADATGGDHFGQAPQQTASEPHQGKPEVIAETGGDHFADEPEFVYTETHQGTVSTGAEIGGDHFGLAPQAETEQSTVGVWEMLFAQRFDLISAPTSTEAHQGTGAEGGLDLLAGRLGSMEIIALDDQQQGDLPIG